MVVDPAGAYALGLAEHVEIAWAPDGSWMAINSPTRQMRLKHPGTTATTVFETLAEGIATEAELTRRAVPDSDPLGRAEVLYLLGRLRDAGFLSYSVVSDGIALATAQPLVPGAPAAPTELPPERELVLSRFAYLRRDGARMVLESPRSAWRVVIRGAFGAALVTALASPITAGDLAATLPGVSEAAVGAFLALLDRAEMLACAGEDEPSEEDPDGALAHWEFHDLLFHARTRRRRCGEPCGGTYRFEDRIPALPAVRPAAPGRTISLYRPDLGRLAETDLPLTRVLEARRSIRTHGVVPIDARELGEFLYRTARLIEVRQGERQELCRKPYPMGGSIGELEIYPLLRECSGIAPGLHRYNADDHSLELVRDPCAETELLLEQACCSSGGSGSPQVLLVITSRFPRLAWKYEGMAYALTLKHVGVLMQTFYLVATAMGLAPCAIGGGDSELFARAAGLSAFAETSVGEFMLGSSPAGATT
jgi:SagB-type dehydrogenase family enzyme